MHKAGSAGRVKSRSGGGVSGEMLKATLSDIQKRVAQVVGGMEKHQLPTLEEQTTTTF